MEKYPKHYFNLTESEMKSLIERRKNVAQVFDQQYKEFENKHLVFSQSWHNHMSGVFPQDDEYMIRLAVAPMNSFILN